MRPDPTILAFDTSAAHCAPALLSGGRIVADRAEAMDTGQAERLVPMLEDLLARAGIAWRNLDALAVGTGPGNFTGVRIAVAAARGLALGLGIPAVGVTRLEALAFGLPRPVTVIEDARRGAAYVQTFGVQPFDGGTAELVDLAAFTLPAHAVTGSAAPARGLAPAMPLAHAIARIAALRPIVPGARPAPFYLRGADALPPADPPPVILP